MNSKLITEAIITGKPLSQLGLHNDEQFCKYPKQYGLNIKRELVAKLWKSGILKCEFAVSHDKISHDGIEYINNGDDGFYNYRLLDNIYNTIGNRNLNDDILNRLTPKFHPFRVVLIYQYFRVFSLHISPLQYLYSKDGYDDILQAEISRLDRFISTGNCSDLFNKWNSIISLCVALEPLFFPEIIGRNSYPMDMTTTIRNNILNSTRELLFPIIRSTDMGDLKKDHQDLVITAEMNDNNKYLHTLIRIMNSKNLMKIKGDVGLSSFIKLIAEVFRRAVEKALIIELPEEDTVGFGVGNSSWKKDFFGTERILDDQNAKSLYARYMGINYHPSVKVYVEGETEYGALSLVFQDDPRIELVNLKGQFVESKRKGLQFKKSLSDDLHKKRFSVIILDKDNPDIERIFKKSVHSGLFFGEYFMMSPDFEYENFDNHDFTQIINTYMNECALEFKVNQFTELLNNVSCGRELINAIQRISPVPPHIDKGEEWGKFLIRYAFENPIKPGTKKQYRTVINVIRKINYLKTENYELYYSKFAVDSEGKLVPK